MPEFQSKRDGRDYKLFVPYEKLPVTVDRAKTIVALNMLYKISTELEKFTSYIGEAGDDLAKFIEYAVPSYMNYYFPFKAEDTQKEITEALTHLYFYNDYVPETEDIITLEDMGYSYLYTDENGYFVYGKVIENSNVEKCVEEIKIKKNSSLRYKKSIDFTSTDWPKEKIQIMSITDPQLIAAIENTRNAKKV